MECALEPNVAGAGLHESMPTSGLQSAPTLARLRQRFRPLQVSFPASRTSGLMRRRLAGDSLLQTTHVFANGPSGRAAFADTI